MAISEPASIEALRLEVSIALGLWLNTDRELSNNRAGILEKFVIHWRMGPCALLRYARATDAKLDSDTKKKLQQLVDKPLGDIQNDESVLARSEFIYDELGLKPTSSNEPKQDTDERNFQIQQLALLTRGFAYAVLASEALRASDWKPTTKELPQDFIRNAQAAMQSFQVAWPLRRRVKQQRPNSTTEDPFDTDDPLLKSSSRQAQSYLAMDVLRRQWNATDVSTWLTMCRLLSYILGEEDAEIPYPNVLATFVTVDSEIAAQVVMRCFGK